MSSPFSDLPFVRRPSPSASAARTAGDIVDRLRQARAPRHPADRHRPFVTLAYAQSVDGSIARARGERFSLSGPESLRLTHALRGNHDAILVGIGTVLADDPELSVRLAEGADPQPIVVDSRLRTPPAARLLSRGGRPPWIGTTAPTTAPTTIEPRRRGSPPDLPAPADHRADDKDNDKEKDNRAADLQRRGARLLRAPALPNGWVDLTALLRALKDEGIVHLMVEGGAQIIAGFLAARLVDYAVVTVAPLFLGGLPAVETSTERPASGPTGGSIRNGGPVPRLHEWTTVHLGDDLIVAGEVRWAGR